MKYLCIKLICLYQVLFSPLIGHHCRFQPTCSEYAKQAFLLHGTIKGAILTAKRLLRCHPWAKAEFDPVPPCLTKKEKHEKR